MTNSIPRYEFAIAFSVDKVQTFLTEVILTIL